MISLTATSINNSYATDYSNAFNNAKAAFLEQSGINTDLKKFGDYGITQLKYLGLETEFGAGLYAYKTYRDRACRLPIGGGKSLTINLNSITLNIPINWR